MADDRPYIDANTRERNRLRELVERLDDEALTTPVNEYWTVAGVLGHIAFWDVRVLVFADKSIVVNRGCHRTTNPRATGSTIRPVR
jgi:DinB family protein